MQTFRIIKVTRYHQRKVFIYGIFPHNHYHIVYLYFSVSHSNDFSFVTSFCVCQIKASFLKIKRFKSGLSGKKFFLYQRYLIIWHQKLAPTLPKAVSKNFFNKKIFDTPPPFIIICSSVTCFFFRYGRKKNR
jgi:hypothetical protein